MGEELRFRLIDPDHWGYDGFRPFHYSADYYYGSNGMMGDNLTHIEKWNRDELENLKWYKSVSGSNADLEEIYNVVYSSTLRLNNRKSSNRFIQALQMKENRDLRNYLEFARSCNAFNSHNQDDPWERQQDKLAKGRIKKMQEAAKLAAKEKNSSLKLRYAFLAIRLAFYAGDGKTVQEYYSLFFKNNSENRDFIWYWAKYFYTITQTPSAETNYQAVQVFMNSAEKRRNIRYGFSDSIPDSESMQFCSNNREKAAFSLFHSARNPKEGLDQMQQFHRLNPGGEELGFMLLREVNKLEDWILTPKYLGYAPALGYLRDTSYKWYNQPDPQFYARLERDKKYASQVLRFVSGVDSKTVNDPILWKMAAAYLHFLVDDKNQAVAVIDQCLTQEKDSTRRIDLEALRTMFVVSRDAQKVNPFADANHHNLMAMRHAQRNRLCFAIARELEMQGKTTIAAMLFQKVSPDDRTGYLYDIGSVVFHKPNKAGKYSWVDFNTNYFLYLDSQYSPEQMDLLIRETKSFATHSDSLYRWLSDGIMREMPRMYDLAGTKYLRQNKLNEALERFTQVNDSLWESDLYAYKEYLDANPFHADFYSAHSTSKFDTIRYNKRTLMQTMLKYKALADSVSHPHRDYYAFLVGNAYLNMTHHGNSWLMRRYYWSTTQPAYGMEDDDEYYAAHLAKEYYELASETARNKDFKVLTLRMAGRCEKHALAHKLMPEWSYEGDFDEDVFNANQTYKRIKTEFPDYYDDVLSNCYSFSHLFKSRMTYGKHR